MGRIRDDATNSIAKIETLRELEALFSPNGRRIVAKALMLYWDTNYDQLDDTTKDQIRSLMDNIFDVWYENRLSLEIYR